MRHGGQCLLQGDSLHESVQLVNDLDVLDPTAAVTDLALLENRARVDVRLGRVKVASVGFHVRLRRGAIVA